MQDDVARGTKCKHGSTTILREKNIALPISRGIDMILFRGFQRRVALRWQDKRLRERGIRLRAVNVST